MTGETIQYELLTEAEKRVLEMSFVVAKIQYIILASCILSHSNGGDEDDADMVINAANNIYIAIQKDTFKMKENDDIETANIIWKENADKAAIAGFTTSVLCIVLMIYQLISGSTIGLIGLGGAALAFPIFFYFKNLSQSRLFLWRCVRILAAIIVVVVAEIIRMVV